MHRFDISHTGSVVSRFIRSETWNSREIEGTPAAKCLTVSVMFKIKVTNCKIYLPFNATFIFAAF